jgi:hypothetical protein
VLLILKGLRLSVRLKQQNRLDYHPREAFSSMGIIATINWYY